MAVSQNNDIEVLIQKFRSATLVKSESSRLNYAKAIRCLETFVGTYTYSQDFPSEQTLADWFLNMRVRGISGKTAIHYFDIIAALYKDTASDVGPDNPKLFGQFKARVKQISGLMKDCPVDNRALNKILSITKSPSAHSDMQQQAADILLYSLLNRAMPLSEVTKVKVSEIVADSDAVSDIVKRNSDPNRKYLFPLFQSKLTPRQSAEVAERKVWGLFIANHIHEVQSVDNTIRLIWTCAALRCGIPGSEIVSLIGQAVDEIPELSLCVKTEIPPERCSALIQTVNTLFSSNPQRWFAMKLRSRVDYEDLEESIRNLDEHIPRPELFYPLDEICKRVGKKIVKDRQPVIRDIVFFKLRVTDIFPLFCKIGDLAWCYTTTGRPGGDYAPIPKSSFERFQETIGHFTPDYEIAPIGGFELEEGERVVILNGLMTNREFEIEKIEDTGNVIFQLNMIGDNGFQWRTKAGRHQLHKYHSDL